MFVVPEDGDIMAVNKALRVYFLFQVIPTHSKCWPLFACARCSSIRARANSDCVVSAYVRSYWNFPIRNSKMLAQISAMVRVGKNKLHHKSLLFVTAWYCPLWLVLHVPSPFWDCCVLYYYQSKGLQCFNPRFMTSLMIVGLNKTSPVKDWSIIQKYCISTQYRYMEAHNTWSSINTRRKPSRALQSRDPHQARQTWNILCFKQKCQRPKNTWTTTDVEIRVAAICRKLQQHSSEMVNIKWQNGMNRSQNMWKVSRGITQNRYWYTFWYSR